MFFWLTQKARKDDSFFYVNEGWSASGKQGNREALYRCSESEGFSIIAFLPSRRMDQRHEH